MVYVFNDAKTEIDELNDLLVFPSDFRIPHRHEHHVRIVLDHQFHVVSNFALQSIEL